MKNENNKTTNIIIILLVLIFLVVLPNALSNSVSSQVPSDESQTVYVNSEGEKRTGFLNYKVFLRLRLLKILNKQLNGKLTIKII